MQYYAQPPHTIQNTVQARHPEYIYPPPGHVTSPRMQWGHPGAWGYEFAAAYPGGYPVNADPQRSPSYHIVSPTTSDSAQGTPHNIRDILGNQQQQHTQPTEDAKTPSSYQKSPTSTAAGSAVYSPEHIQQHMRSPTTPNAPIPPMTYAPDPHSFYIPAMHRGMQGE